MQVIFIRHGKTYGNLKKRYIGKTDEALCLEGINEIKKIVYPFAEKVVSSSLKRCSQTAELIYGKNYEKYDDLRECYFGDFENKKYEELKDNPKYIEWVASNGKKEIPNGESFESFCERCCDCFEKIISESEVESIAFVVHGGTIMAILKKFFEFEKDFYDWQIKNAHFVCFQVEKNEKKIILKQA